MSNGFGILSYHYPHSIFDDPIFSQPLPRKGINTYL